MDNYQGIIRRLESFTRKFYTKQLIRGTLLFLSLGLLFWIIVLSLEYLLWMDQGWRLVLFWGFVAVELLFLYKLILVPLLYLFRLKKGIDAKQAALLIGKHFPEVDDKLYNLLELSGHPQKSDLLRASIEQRSQKLGPVPFSRAIDLKEGYRVAKYIMVPVLILGLIWVSGNLLSFFNSHQRLVNYELAYERPAPFMFKVLNEHLQVLDNQALILKVALEGEVRPEQVYLVMDGEELLLQQIDGIYTHTFGAPVPKTSFFLTANGWDSMVYSLESLPTPALMDFQMELSFPTYLGRPNEVVKGSGNAIVPEGTQVSWTINGLHVDRVVLDTKDTVLDFEKEGDRFTKTLRLSKDLDYELSTSNAYVQDFEPLGYGLKVIRDGHAQVAVEQFLDSVDPNRSYYSGQAADDHGIQSINLVCYPLDNRDAVQRVVLERPNTNIHRFYYSFPSGLDLEAGRGYGLYFEVVDNDGLRGGKVTESQRFNTQVLDNRQLRDRELEFQNSTLSKMDGSLQEYREQQQTLSKINDRQKQNNELSFEDKGQIRDFLQKQQQQESLMKKFSQELGESLSKNQGDPMMQQMLKERLQRQEMEAKRNAELLEELQKVAQKLKKEELEQRLEELGKNQGNNIRGLEQILELTKRYYVTEKASQLARALEQLAKEQEGLSHMGLEQNPSGEEQQDLNTGFKELEKQLQELERDNRALKKPLGLGDSKKETESIKQDQKDALEELKKQIGREPSQSVPGKEAQERISKRQRSAAQKMQELSQSLEQGGGAGASSDSEDMEMLRQILDNLLRFSFKQEELFDHINDHQVDVSEFSATVKEQQDLRRLFEHVDDSLFALSLRRVELSEFVNEQISEVYYNLDKSLENIADNQMYQGASHQQYVINSTNALADFLANVLDNMQQSLSPGGGSGDKQDFQLPDIIQGQQQIKEQMEGQGKQGKGSQDQDRGKQGDGKEDGQGEGMEKGAGEGQNGSSGDGMDLEELYEIYKEQQFLRQKLEGQLQDMIRREDRDLTQKLLGQMEDFQNDLLENGITERTLQKANNIQHQLMKLENATLEQGEDRQRESTIGQRDHANPIISKPEQLEDYSPGVEILNRQALPLRRKYEEKVKLYFKND